MIFMFIKNESDLIKYVLFLSLSNIIGNAIMWVPLPMFLCKIKVKELRFQKHILPALKLFIPTIAISVYTLLDKTLIGLLIQILINRFR